MTPSLLLALLLSTPPSASDDASLRELRGALTFHAPFDGGVDAAFARGDRRAYTSPSGDGAGAVSGVTRDDVVLEKGKGRHGDALRFGKKARPAVLFKAEKNVAYRERDWSGTVSLWRGAGILKFWRIRPAPSPPGFIALARRPTP